MEPPLSNRTDRIYVAGRGSRHRRLRAAEHRPRVRAAAGVARFRAILLTSLTTFAGLLPLIFEQSTQAQFLIPMAVSLGFGILFATFITLLLVPIAYLVLEDVKQLATHAGGARRRGAAHQS